MLSFTLLNEEKVMDIIVKTARYMVSYSSLEPRDKQLRHYAGLISYLIDMPIDSASRMLQFAIDEIETSG